MRFRQLQKKSNVILRKKMYKSGKNWVVKSSLAIISGLTLFGISQTINVKADTVPIGQEDTSKTTTVDSASENISDPNKVSTNDDAQSAVTPGATQNLPVNSEQKDQSTETPTDNTDNIDENNQKSNMNVFQAGTDQQVGQNSSDENSVNSQKVATKAVATDAAANPVQAKSTDDVPTLD